MPLVEEVSSARKKIYRDGYDMSLGEIASLYDRDEIVINPEYQRLFRWDETQKTRFIESLLLNIPIPPIFVFSSPEAKWELVDGLQRVSTVLQFMRKLKGHDPFKCSGTQLIPSLSDVMWPEEEQEDVDDPGILPSSLQISIKRARIRVEILGQETDSHVKFELFQRLNTGGSNLSEQEVRNCVIASLNIDALHRLRALAAYDNFRNLVEVGDVRLSRQYDVELVLRFFVFRKFQYDRKLDVHEFLDQSVVALAGDAGFDWEQEEQAFRTTFDTLQAVGGADTFRKSNRFSLAYYEFITLGVSKYLDRVAGKVDAGYLRSRLDAMRADPQIEQHTGAGVRGTQRLGNIIFARAEQFFQE